MSQKIAKYNFSCHEKSEKGIGYGRLFPCDGELSAVWAEVGSRARPSPEDLQSAEEIVRKLDLAGESAANISTAIKNQAQEIASNRAAREAGMPEKYELILD